MREDKMMYSKHVYLFSGDDGVLAEIVKMTKEGCEIDLHKSHKVFGNDYMLFYTKPEVQEEQSVEEQVQAEDSEEIESEQTEEISEGILEELESLSKKQEMLDFAERVGVEVPEDIKMPNGIKKYLKENI